MAGAPYESPHSFARARRHAPPDRSSRRASRFEESELRRREPARSEFAEGVRESTPFLFFGIICLLLAVWLAVSNPVPGNPIPIWTLLAGIGVAALAGGLIAPFFPGEAPPARPRRKHAPEPDPEEEESEDPEEPQESECPPPSSMPGPVPPTPAAPPAPAPRPWVEDEEDSERSPTHFEFESPAPAVMPIQDRPVVPAGLAAADEVLQSIDELTHQVRRNARSTRMGPVREPAPRRVCGNCERSFSGDESATNCRSCGLTLCPDCREDGARAGHAGLCTTCLLLGPDPASASAA